ncbi:hypothetical protein RS75_05195 [Rhizobium nepotum 39/7]|uniref:LysR substrate-binding domain-containing protein n=1 Tax=Rhizobium nepotum 39/7 TaxID=1368418 RepID=A0ABR5CVH7_9HYPH|nr:hypothetical protein RS75_05195 [Rhizobium nepotum 39/7]
MFSVIPEAIRGALLGDIPYQENNISRQVPRLYCYVSRDKLLSADIFYNIILEFRNIDAGYMLYTAE